ncbi:hypothetical protein [Microbulbifer sediminum]|uniref:hypothetical protein n=1 Tax=Microbulbifer sediminum TaxID=2904250 RepID=UPI001F247818|nr:hypothetical protein [Microbulbifer sediminum]
MHSTLRSALAGLILAVPGVVIAAGETDFKDIQVNLNIPERIVVDQLDNIDLSAVAGTDAAGADAFCVGGTGFATYSIQFDSNAGGATNEFLLANVADTSLTVPYSVGYSNDETATDAASFADEGVVLPGNLRRDFRCGAGYENAKLFVNVAANDWQNATGGDYSDTLTVTVVAE